MSNTSILKNLRELMQVDSNDELMQAVTNLGNKPQPVVLAVSWTPGTPELEAQISILGKEQVVFNDITAALRAALAVMDWQATQRAARLQAQLQRIQQEKSANETVES